MRQSFRPTVTVAGDPLETPLTLDDVKKHLRVTWADEDDTIGAYLSAAVDLLDGPAGWLGRAIVSQDWRHVSRPTLCGVEWLTAEPTALVSITYLDADEEEQTANVADFRTGTDGFSHYVAPVKGKSWPAMASRNDSLRIVYTTGFEDGAAVPTSINQAIKLMVGHWFKEREAATVANMHEMPFAVTALLERHKRGFVAS